MAVQGTTGFLSAKILAVYDRMLLTRAVDNLVFDMYGQSKSIKANSNTKEAFAYRYKNVLPATTPLAEYDGTNIINGNKIVREEITYGVGHYGDYITYTDELDLYDLDNIQSSFLDIMGDQASLTLDTITRDVLRGGTNVIYSDGATSRLTVADSGKIITTDDLELAALKLKNQRGKKFKKVITGTTSVGTTPIRSAYIGLISPEITPGLRKLSGWRNVEDYADYGKTISEDEVGSYGDFRFVESFNNEPIADQGTSTDINVYLTLLMAQDSYTTATIRGKGAIQSKVKPLGSAGTLDPLDQFGTIGWKAIYGAAILNEAWLIRLESTSNFEDDSVKHYYDYS